MQLGTALEQVIELENSLLDQLIEYATEKQSKINDPDAIAAIVQSEQQVLHSLEQAELERRTLLDAIAPGESLDAWVTAANNPQLAASVKMLGDKIVQLQTMNERNQLLLQESLAFVQFNLNILLNDQAQTYAKPGIKSSTRSIFDRKV